MKITIVMECGCRIEDGGGPQAALTHHCPVDTKEQREKHFAAFLRADEKLTKALRAKGWLDGLGRATQ